VPALTPVQRDVLRALVDTAVPALPSDDDPHGFWATPGSAVGADVALEEFLAQGPEADQDGIAQLLDALAMLGFQHQGRATREGMLATAQALAPEALVAIATLRGGACMLAHAIVDETGQNPYWKQYGYPGPAVPAPQEDARITPHVPTDGEVLEADVVVVGSGAGGGVIAGVLATQGKRVVVLEASGLSAPKDYRQLEIEASTTMMYRGGLAMSADGNIGLLAGATLGGGTTINWQNCYKPSDAVRRETDLAIAVRPPVGNGADHRADVLGTGRRGGTDDPRDTAHGGVVLRSAARASIGMSKNALLGVFRLAHRGACPRLAHARF